MTYVNYTRGYNLSPAHLQRQHFAETQSIMDRLLLEFRHSPTAYLASRGISSQELVEELLQVHLTYAVYTTA